MDCHSRFMAMADQSRVFYTAMANVVQANLLACERRLRLDT